MRKRLFSSSAFKFNFIHQPTWKSHPQILSKNEILPGIKREHFQARIDKLKAQLPSNSVVIIPSYKTKYGSQNIFYPFQQNNNLLYFTGFNEPDCCLILEKKEADESFKMVESFFVTPNDETTLLWSGPRAGIDGAKELFGIQNIFTFEKLKDFFKELSRSKNKQIFVDYQPENSSISSEIYNKINNGNNRIKSLEPLTTKLRLVKSPEELELMKKSGQIAGESFKETIIYSKKAKNEAELAGFMDFKVKTLGGERLAYVPVVAGSNRGLVLHYTHNNQSITNSDWMLMDAGAQYFGYSSDITRSWPLSGKFSESQARLYEAVLKVQTGCKIAIETIPNISFSKLNEVAVYLTAVELEKLGFKDVERNVNKWFPHSIGHHLGLDLHDCPKHNPNDPLIEGNVITIEPGVYVPMDDANAPKEFRGLAIRIEDDFIIQNGGKELINLTSSIPKTISEIESLLN